MTTDSHRGLIEFVSPWSFSETVERVEAAPTTAEIARYMGEVGFEPVVRQEATAFYRVADNVAVLDAHTGILDAIDAASAAGRNVYVHCWGGSWRIPAQER